MRDAFVEGGTGNAYFKGNVGIGTTGPTYPLHLKTEWGFLALDSNAAGQDAGLRLMEGGAVKWHVWNAAGLDSKFLIRNKDFRSSLCIDQAGKVGIGTEDPKVSLHVPGGAILNSVAIGVTPPHIGIPYPPGVEPLKFPYPHETIGTIDPQHNLRLHSFKSILLHSGNASNPTAAFDRATTSFMGDLIVRERLVVYGRITLRGDFGAIADNIAHNYLDQEPPYSLVFGVEDHQNGNLLFYWKDRERNIKKGWISGARIS